MDCKNPFVSRIHYTGILPVRLKFFMLFSLISTSFTISSKIFMLPTIHFIFLTVLPNCLQECSQFFASIFKICSTVSHKCHQASSLNSHQEFSMFLLRYFRVPGSLSVLNETSSSFTVRFLAVSLKLLHRHSKMLCCVTLPSILGLYHFTSEGCLNDVNLGN